ncbi:MAG TPA: helicase [Gammaproteobacteria bacterium]|nr:helicase [Gammaproteobacteria bacterium]
MTELSHYFDDDGLLAQEVPGFVVRNQQLEMATAVAASISNEEISFLEAGTGTGKTFAYLVPLFLSGKKVMIATGTKTLQDQLNFQDLPLISRFFPRHRSALLKGRSNYLCPNRLEKFLKVMVSDEPTLAQLVRIRSWATSSVSGDLGEAPQVEAHVVPLITSTRDNCLGSGCPQFDTCPLYAARKRAQEADVIVVNHHLLFADLALKEDSLSSVLPKVDAIVVDEAHQVPDIARQFFGASVSSRSFGDLIRDLRGEMSLLGNDDPALLNQINQLEAALDAMIGAILAGNADFDQWFQCGGQSIVEEVDHSLAELREALDVASGRSQGLDSGRRRVEQIADDFVLLTEPTSLDDFVHWIDRTRTGFTVHLSPIDVAQTIGQLFSPGAWIFCSATLCVDGSFSHIRRALGVEEAVEQRFLSPFDFQRQVRACLPPDLPVPGSDDHTYALVEAVKPVLSANHGRTFFLCTSYRAMNIVRDLLSDSHNLFVQGVLPRHELMAAFRRTERSILLATHSFWQGVDVKGAGLTCVIIDKLPFASPEEPLPRATMQAIDTAGGNGFVDYLLPQAIIALNQGFGRLIRAESDRGLFILGDPRIFSRSYGGLVLSSLPEMEWIEMENACQYIGGISERSGN